MPLFLGLGWDEGVVVELTGGLEAKVGVPGFHGLFHCFLCDMGHIA